MIVQSNYKHACTGQQIHETGRENLNTNTDDAHGLELHVYMVSSWLLINISLYK